MASMFYKTDSDPQEGDSGVLPVCIAICMHVILQSLHADDVVLYVPCLWHCTLVCIVSC